MFGYNALVERHMLLVVFNPKQVPANLAVECLGNLRAGQPAREGAEEKKKKKLFNHVQPAPFLFLFSLSSVFSRRCALVCLKFVVCLARRR